LLHLVAPTIASSRGHEGEEEGRKEEDLSR
jgi:hypothetical protein